MSVKEFGRFYFWDECSDEEKVKKNRKVIDPKSQPMCFIIIQSPEGICF